MFTNHASRRSSLLRAALLTFAATMTSAPRAQTACPEPTPDTRVEALDSFSNVRFTAEHEYGYRVWLWKAGTCFVGLLYYSAGLQGDTPRGLLENVRNDPATGALSFGAKLTIGLATIRENGELVSRPSQDYFTFRGTLDLQRNSLDGTIVHEQRTAPGRPQPEPEAVALPARTPPEVLYPDAATYGDWRQQLEPILQALGPKW